MKIRIIAFATALLLVGLLLVLILQSSRTTTPNEDGVYPIPTQTPTTLSTVEKADGWKEYISNEHGFSIALPEEYSIELINETRSNVSPVVEEIAIRNENDTQQVRLTVNKYKDGDNFYDLIDERNSQQNYYIAPTEVYVNTAKGIYSIESIGTKSSAVLYAFPHTTETYILVSYSALKSEIESDSRPQLIQDQIVKSFTFI